MRNLRLLLIVLLMGALLAGVSTATAQPTPPPTRTIQVQGVGAIAVDPNGAFFDVVIISLNSSVTDAFRQVRERLGRVREAVVAIGVAPEDVRVADVRSETIDRVDSRQGNSPTGELLYRVVYVVRVTIRQFALLDSVIQAAFDAGADSVLNWFPLYDDYSDITVQARALATADAQARAQAIADGFGLILQQPVSINETVQAGLAVTAVRLENETSGRFVVVVVLNVTYLATAPVLSS